ncbi:TPA: branched-chain amino acid ABC transporter permease, partial [Vibrio parahaemolyticus]|nr:branched-chain amino acid ABC transporter permease [Vibrio parahaemolyticus]
MVAGGPKNLRIFAIWGMAAASSLMAYWYLPENSHVVVGAIAGGILGACWKEKKA